MREEALGGRAALAVNCVPSVVPVTPGEARLRRARRRRMVKKVAASTPVVSAARSETPTPAYCPWHAATEPAHEPAPVARCRRVPQNCPVLD